MFGTRVKVHQVIVVVFVTLSFLLTDFLPKFRIALDMMQAIAIPCIMFVVPGYLTYKEVYEK